MKPIAIQFDNNIDAYIVLMPEYISLDSLHLWAKELDCLLKWRKPQEDVALLIDTNRHQFESIECLKFLRDFLSNDSAIVRHLSCAAFVSPKDTRPAQIVSAKEAYFTEFDDAYQWLKEK